MITRAQELCDAFTARNAMLPALSDFVVSPQLLGRETT